MVDILKMKKRIYKTIESKNYIELCGGIYFKLVIIIIKLIRLSPNQDYSNLL